MFFLGQRNGRKGKKRRGIGARGEKTETEREQETEVETDDETNIISGTKVGTGTDDREATEVEAGIGHTGIDMLKEIVIEKGKKHYKKQLKN